MRLKTSDYAPIFLLALCFIDKAPRLLGSSQEKGVEKRETYYNTHVVPCCHLECCCTTCQPEDCQRSAQQLLPMNLPDNNPSPECTCQSTQAFTCSARQAQPYQQLGNVHPPGAYQVGWNLPDANYAVFPPPQQPIQPVYPLPPGAYQTPPTTPIVIPSNTTSSSTQPAYSIPLLQPGYAIGPNYYPLQPSVYNPLEQVQLGYVVAPNQYSIKQIEPGPPAEPIQTEHDVRSIQPGYATGPTYNTLSASGAGHAVKPIPVGPVPPVQPQSKYNTVLPPIPPEPLPLPSVPPNALKPDCHCQSTCIVPTQCMRIVPAVVPIGCNCQPTTYCSASQLACNTTATEGLFDTVWSTAMFIAVIVLFVVIAGLVICLVWNCFLSDGRGRAAKSRVSAEPPIIHYNLHRHPSERVVYDDASSVRQQ